MQIIMSYFNYNIAKITATVQKSVTLSRHGNCRHYIVCERLVLPAPTRANEMSALVYLLVIFHKYANLD